MQVDMEHLFDENSASFHDNGRIQWHSYKNDSSYKYLYTTRFIVHPQ